MVDRVSRAVDPLLAGPADRVVVTAGAMSTMSQATPASHWTMPPVWRGAPGSGTRPSGTSARMPSKRHIGPDSGAGCRGCPAGQTPAPRHPLSVTLRSPHRLTPTSNGSTAGGWRCRSCAPLGLSGVVHRGPRAGAVHRQRPPRPPRRRVARGGILGRGDSANIEDFFALGYRGARFSLGNGACPELADRAGIVALLGPDRIGVTWSEEYQGTSTPDN